MPIFQVFEPTPLAILSVSETKTQKAVAEARQEVTGSCLPWTVNTGAAAPENGMI